MLSIIGKIKTLSNGQKMKEDSRPNALGTAISDFMKLESASGILLLVTSVLAMIIANSPFTGFYDQLLSTTVAVQIGALEINKPLLLWINDGLMAIFFFPYWAGNKARDNGGRTLIIFTGGATWDGRSWRHVRASRYLCLAKLE